MGNGFIGFLAHLFWQVYYFPYRALTQNKVQEEMLNLCFSSEIDKLGPPHEFLVHVIPYGYGLTFEWNRTAEDGSEHTLSLNGYPNSSDLQERFWITYFINGEHPTSAPFSKEEALRRTCQFLDA